MDIPSRITSINSSTFSGCVSLTSVDIPQNVTSIDANAFKDCSSLKSVNLSNRVTSIGEFAFSGCTALTSVVLPDTLLALPKTAFDCKLYTNKGTKTLLTLWNPPELTPYDITSDKEILPPSLKVMQTTQTTSTIQIENWVNGYTYLCNDEEKKSDEFQYANLKPNTPHDLTLIVSLDTLHYETYGQFTTRSLSPCINSWVTTASSFSATGTYTEEDAKVVSEKISVGGILEDINGNQCFVSGLNPGKNYNVRYTIEVDYGGETTAFYTGTQSIYTNNLYFNTAAPKVVSEGNVIVSAAANLDEGEENVGFEWRCTDWTDEFPSNTGTAYLYEGTIEGYIKNLNTDKLWKFRPYYLSDSGTYHYGSWMGLDPTNTSYFEPTVHTYAKISIEGNTALVRGYVLGGTDDVVVKGFKYWRTGSPASTRATSIPADALAVEATGQQAMSANLKGLDYNSTYHYAAFATTVTGETYYGEEQSFTTPLATAQYATFYDSQSAYILPSGLTASVVTGVSGGKLVYKTIAEGGKSNNVLPKGVAVMLTSAKEDASSYTLKPTDSGTTYTGANLLRGSDEDTTTQGDGNCWFYKLSYGASGTERSEVFGWYWGAANGGAFAIKGHKAWLAVPKSAGAPTRAFGIGGETLETEETTGIEEVEANEEEADVYYDLQGRRIPKPTSRGIYIHNGKKIIIR